MQCGLEIRMSRNSNKSAANSLSGRAEVIAAIEDLADKVAHLGRSLRPVVPTKARHAPAAIRKEEMNLALSEAFLVPDDHAQPEKSEEAGIFSLSPHQNMPCNVYIAEATEEFAPAMDAPVPESKQAPCREKNAIATRVAELCDRLGGFKASLLDVPDQGT